MVQGGRIVGPVLLTAVLRHKGTVSGAPAEQGMCTALD